MNDLLTIGDIARQHGVELWRVRRVVDDLDVKVERAALYRLVPRSALPLIADGLRERGWLPSAAEVAAP